MEQKNRFTTTDPIGTVELLLIRWRNIAKRKHLEAKEETNYIVKRLIEYEAICYQNCAKELEGWIFPEYYSKEEVKELLIKNKSIISF